MARQDFDSPNAQTVKLLQYMDDIKTGVIPSCAEYQAQLRRVERVMYEDDTFYDQDRLADFERFAKRHMDMDMYDAQYYLVMVILCLYIRTDYKPYPPRFNEILIMMGRGGGKTTLLSTVSMYGSSKLGIKNYNVDISAAKKDQSKITFNKIYQVLESNKIYYKKHYHWTKQIITHKKSGSQITPLAQNADTMDGRAAGLALFDEIHSLRDTKMIDVISSSLGKVDGARVVHITTDGHNRGGVLSDYLERANVTITSDDVSSKFCPIIFKLDDPQEVHDPAMWVKANPAIPYFHSLRMQIQDEYDKMEDSPQIKRELLTKRMNCPPTNIAESIITPAQVQWCTDHDTNLWQELVGLDCVGGVDYADTTDFCAVGLLFKNQGRYYWLSHSFINKLALDKVTFSAPIQKWADDKLCTIVPEDADMTVYISTWFLKMSKYYRIKGIATDAVRIKQVRSALSDVGFKDNQFLVTRAGAFTHTELYPIITDMFRLRHMRFNANDAMSRWYFTNTYAQYLDAGSDTVGHKNKAAASSNNVRFAKINPKTRKTDGFDSYVHALKHINIVKDRKKPIILRKKAS